MLPFKTINILSPNYSRKPSSPNKISTLYTLTRINANKKAYSVNLFLLDNMSIQVLHKRKIKSPFI